MAIETADPKPSGAAFQAPLDLSFEVGLIFSRLLTAIYASLHPINVVLAALALLLIHGAELSWTNSEKPTVSEMLVTPVMDMPNNFGFGDQSPSFFRVSGVGPVVVAEELMRPWWELVHRNWWRGLFLALFSLAVWSWVGTMICRHVALNLGSLDYTWREVFRFTNQHYLDSLFSILIPLAAVTAILLPLALCGGLLVGDWTSILGAPLALIGTVAGLLVGVILLGLVLAWPLMFPAIAFEGRDSFESISRAYAYILQRPLHALLLAATAWAFGTAVAFGIELFCSLSAGGYVWALSWGANVGDGQRLAELLQSANAGESAIIQYWTTPVLRTGVEGFYFLGRAASFSVFWGLASGVYLLLRRYLDQTPLDEVYRPGQATLKPLE
jgi:hypothetical protein